MQPKLFLRLQPEAPSAPWSLRKSLYRLQQGTWILHLRLRRNGKKHLRHFPAQENQNPCCHWTILLFHLPFAYFLLIPHVSFTGIITKWIHNNSYVKPKSREYNFIIYKYFKLFMYPVLLWNTLQLIISPFQKTPGKPFFQDEACISLILKRQ